MPTSPAFGSPGFALWRILVDCRRLLSCDCAFCGAFLTCLEDVCDPATFFPKDTDGKFFARRAFAASFLGGSDVAGTSQRCASGNRCLVVLIVIDSSHIIQPNSHTSTYCAQKEREHREHFAGTRSLSPTSSDTYDSRQGFPQLSNMQDNAFGCCFNCVVSVGFSCSPKHISNMRRFRFCDGTTRFIKVNSDGQSNFLLFK